MSFRGSHEDINWVSNLDIALTSLKTVVSGAPSNVLVHDGKDINLFMNKRSYFCFRFQTCI